MAIMPRFEAFKAVSASKLNDAMVEIERLATGLFGNTTNTVSPLFRVSRTSNLAVATASYTVIPWQAVDEDPDGMWDPGDPELIIIRTPGVWVIQGQIRYQANINNDRFNEPTLNTTTSGAISAGFTRGTQSGRGGDGNAVPVSFAGRFAEGDIIRDYAYQDSGTTLNVQPSPTGGTYFTGFWLAP